MVVMSAHTTDRIIPFHTYLWKIVSRCNLNCSYCYVYNSVDDSWRSQPVVMSEKVARQTATRIREHLEAHGKKDAVIILHGGEPLLAGIRRIKELVSIIGDVFCASEIRVSIGTQSNLLPFTETIGDYYLSQNMTIGVSIDGPPEINDLYRRDHKGRPSSEQLQAKLRLLTSPRYRRVFSGFLSVINLDANPIDVTDYLLSFNPPSIDFLLPLDNYDRRPKGKPIEASNETPYGDWLIRSFDHWWGKSTRSRIRIFTSIISMICGSDTLVESLGLLPIDLIVIETNGRVEGVDSLKSAFNGATNLNFDIFRHSFDVVARHVAVQSRQRKANGLCKKCQTCQVVDVCGGGYLPHRYSSERGFDNPSVYCSDLEKLIRHIHATLTSNLSLDSTQAPRT